VTALITTLVGAANSAWESLTGSAPLPGSAKADAPEKGFAGLLAAALVPGGTDRSQPSGESTTAKASAEAAPAGEEEAGDAPRVRRAARFPAPVAHPDDAAARGCGCG
jgi:hypothetical protein